MPCLAAPRVQAYDRAEDIPKEVLMHLRAHATNANVILPTLEKALRQRPSKPHCWITYAPARSAEPFEFILSVTEGPMGSYPVFIMSTWSSSELRSRPGCLGPVSMLVDRLRARVDVGRVYSIFAPKPISEAFAQLWTQSTGVAHYAQDPYYAAKLSYCTRVQEAATAAQASVFPFALRPAGPQDFEGVKGLCFEFAESSEPFTLTLDRAAEEARYLIANRLVWVCASTEPGLKNMPGRDIACIVAFTRNSDRVATVSKVCTSKNFRRRGCAESLMRAVCKSLLAQRECVVLYVAHDNASAIRCYDNVGFLGLKRGGPAVSGVDDWLEIGFDRDVVTLGHW